MNRSLFHPISLLAAVLLCALLAPCHAADTRWAMVSSAHFTVVTDAGDKRGREVALRFEQMRAMFAGLLLRTRLNVAVPPDIYALANAQEYGQTAPMRGTAGSPGYFLPGEDRNYIVLDLSSANPWQAIEYDFARALMNYNYPPAQPWFDEGFAQYFATLQLDDKQAQVGEVPTEFRTLLNAQAWTPIPDLFAVKADAAAKPQPLFSAESWVVMHYLLAKNKLTETGSYFDLVLNRNVAIPQAIEQAYGMSAAQFDQAVKDYFRTLNTQVANSQQTSPGVETLPTPVPAENFPATLTPVNDTEAAAMLAEIRVRMPERRAQAVEELHGMVKEAAAATVSTDNSIIHRALAWALLENKDYQGAMQELSEAMDIDPKDPWVRYYLVLVKYRVGESSGGSYPGLANMMQDVRIVLDWYPEFAEAYNMLGMARIQGGGANSAMESLRAAMRISPRNQSYVLNLARAYMAAKKWEAASELLIRLINNPDARIAAAAKRNLEDMPYLQKYGILPVHPEDAKAQQAAKVAEPARATVSERVAKASAGENEDEDEESPRPAPGPDKRPVKFLKGRLMSVDCSQAPVATVTVTAAGKTLRVRTGDYKSLLLIGADKFSCDWKNLPVSVNYKAGGKADGDLVSIEVQ
jgi:tetratricopeptide (TPR) repeat protein